MVNIGIPFPVVQMEKKKKKSKTNKRENKRIALKDILRRILMLKTQKKKETNKTGK